MDLSCRSRKDPEKIDIVLGGNKGSTRRESKLEDTAAPIYQEK